MFLKCSAPVMVSANLPEEVFPSHTFRLLPDACFAASLPSPTTATRCCQYQFLEVLSDHESRLIEQQLLSESQSLSPRMKDFMETGLS
ncbi:hypothetical protein N7489_001013 [Penicillium chrysogenum]|uniref:uncharacterized protein n=1 Tax=Penicillium chrysogenum TaxID=5076 RepID=UPI00238214DC|nr:uncharacterized protein N7489_001013 [Penicillium chrysogenum]KAJ5250603.1 hypothetical protein N7489_001013 [Penicillium chrysogenum]KAJ5266213.1 hypothetical protein N7524_007231 [Penicillium chrysogenum]